MGGIHVTLVWGTFFDVHGANEAVDRLLALGYPREYISIMMSADTKEQTFGKSGEDRADNVARGVAEGGAIGGALGAIIAAFTLTGAIGATIATGGAAAPFIAGPLAAALAGGGAGAAAGGIIGGAIGAGIPAEHAESIEEGLQAGGIVVVVDARDDDIAEVKEVLKSDPPRPAAEAPSEMAAAARPTGQPV
jgi:hypothetical protein